MAKGKMPTERKPSTDESTLEDGHDLEKELDRQIGDLVPQKARVEVVKRVASIVVSEFFSGPIAHPRHLAQYEHIQPGAADRIIRMAEDRNQHHIAMDHKIADAEIADRALGMKLGAGLFAVLIISALVVALFSQDPVLTGIFLGATVLGGIGLFIRGRNRS